MSSLLPYLQNQDPFAGGLVINPEDLPEEVANLVRRDQRLRDGIDSEQELRQLMEMLNRNSGDLNGLPRPSFDTGGGMTSADMLQALIDWIQSGGPEANKRISRPRPIGNLSSSNNYSAQPASWNGGGGSSGGGVSGGGGTTSSGGTGGATSAPSGTSSPQTPPGEIPKSFKDAEKAELTAAEKADVAWDSLTPQLQQAAMIAKAMGLTITSGAEGHDGDGVHTSGSNHYSGRAIDVAGSPEAMARFYDTMNQLDPQARELFYDPRGGIKNGSEIGAIGGHGDHVHYAA